MDAMGVLINGSKVEKLHFMFQVYDINGKFNSGYTTYILLVYP